MTHSSLVGITRALVEPALVISPLLAEASLQVGVVVDVKAQQAQLVQGDLTDRGGVSPMPPVKHSIQTTVHGGGAGTDVLARR